MPTNKQKGEKKEEIKKRKIKVKKKSEKRIIIAK